MKTQPAAAAPGMRLNRRMKDIIATGILPYLSPSSLVVLTYAAAYGDFTTCAVYLGGKTIAGTAFNGVKNRGSARRGIAELVAVGLLAQVKAATYRRAAVYRITLVPELVAAAQARFAAIGEKRRKSAAQLKAEAEAKKRQAREGAHGCAPRGLMDEPPGGSWVSPEGAHGCAPNPTPIVPESLRERAASGRSARRSQGQAGNEHARRVRDTAVKRRGA